MNVSSPLIIRLIDLALEEDIGSGDITTTSCVPESLKASAKLLAKQDLVFCGESIFTEIFRRIDKDFTVNFLYHDGNTVKSGDIVAELSGQARALLIAERTALNFVQRLSGISTKTRELTDLINTPNVKLVDTRKTTPGWRALEKYAVRQGGGENHRFGLYDAVLIKNNHIDANDGDLKKCVLEAKSKNKPGTFIQVEVRNLNELAQALEVEPDSILLDNMSPEQTIEAVKIARSKLSKLLIESSGGINEDNILSYSKTGVDRISLGALTHSAVAVDLSLKIELLDNA